VRALIVGAGLTGCTIAHRLAQHGIESVLLERAPAPGGLIRSDHLEGVLYEPHGSHVFHTDDEEVWRLANAMTPFNGYRHRVGILIEGRLLNWPILISDIDRQSRAQDIRRELAERRDVDPDARARASDFEAWCLELMGPTLYERYVKPYTQKQWGRPPSELAAEWAPRRVAVRWDDDPYLFADRFQGWPAGPNGYADLVDGLLDSPRIVLRTGVDVSLRALAAHLAREAGDVAVLTCPLDVFCAGRLGALEWRGVAVRSVHVPHVQLAQAAMVVNYPAPEYPFIRIHETKHASGQRCEGTVLGFEFTGAPARHYPVELARTRALNDRYQAFIRELVPNVVFAGRLAAYAYLDMDDCMRQALDCADALVSAARPSAAAPAADRRGGRT
jgi:UDP-galactopyranose mutase